MKREMGFVIPKRDCLNYAFPLKLDVEAGFLDGGVAMLRLGPAVAVKKLDEFHMRLTADEARMLGRFLIALADAAEIVKPNMDALDDAESTKSRTD